MLYNTIIPYDEVTESEPKSGKSGRPEFKCYATGHVLEDRPLTKYTWARLGELSSPPGPHCGVWAGEKGACMDSKEWS
jgi:hypothetical protein